MPFPDEPFAHTVRVLPYRPQWAVEGKGLVRRLRTLVPSAVAVDHIGSTSVPGMPAKDCLDSMVRVRSLERAELVPLTDAGYRERPEEWNRVEVLGDGKFPKRVFAPPVGGRPVNIHVREAGSPTARYALLFRDFLRADVEARETWGELKSRLAGSGLDLLAYGQVKAAAQPLLMRQAELWAAQSSWRP